jgi:hypothetical protein
MQRKEVKVNIPVELHVMLRSVKVVQGKLIEDQVTEALEAYFARPEFAAVLAQAQERMRLPDPEP